MIAFCSGPAEAGAAGGGRPSLVPSTMSSRMNSASAAKTWKISRSPGAVVSRASCSEMKPMPRLHRSAKIVVVWLDELQRYLDGGRA